MINKFYIVFFILILIFSGCSNNSKSSNTNNTNASSNTQEETVTNINNKLPFFDMKYVYKAVRVDKDSFRNALTNYYQDSYYSNIINRNKDFLNKKLVGDNDIKKYAIDFISNAYHYSYRDDISGDDLYADDFTPFYASEYIYVERNLALKKARDLLLSINNKDADIYFALFLSHMACDSLYCFPDLQNHLKDWKKSGGTNISMMIGIVGEYDNANEIYSNKMNLVNYIIEAPEDLRAEQLIADAFEKKFLKYISRNTGYLDVYNENNYNISSIIYEGTAHISSIGIIKDVLNTNIMNRYIRTYASGALNRNKIDPNIEYYENFYNIENTSPKEKYDEFADLYFLEFNKNTFVYAIENDKLKEVYYFNPLFIGNTRYAVYEADGIFNFRLGDDSKLTLAKTNAVKNNNLKDFVTNSNFITNGKFQSEEYAEYLNDILSFPLYYPNFFLCDINNDGKEEIMVTGTYDHSGGRGGIASYTLLLKDNLELDLESAAGKSINSSSKQGLNTYQKIYEEEGKNKMLLVDYQANTAQDIFTENGVVSVDEFTYKNYKFVPKLLWKADLIEKALKTDASFDMNKAGSDSDKAIVSDKTLRIADKLISGNYYREREKLNEGGKEKLLENRRLETKAIQDKQGNVEEIEKEMTNILEMK